MYFATIVYYFADFIHRGLFFSTLVFVGNYVISMTFGKPKNLSYYRVLSGAPFNRSIGTAYN